MKYCSECGSEIEQGTRFCSACGTPVDSLGRSSHTTPAGPPSAAASLDQAKQAMTALLSPDLVKRAVVGTLAVFVGFYLILLVISALLNSNVFDLGNADVSAFWVAGALVSSTFLGSFGATSSLIDASAVITTVALGSLFAYLAGLGLVHRTLLTSVRPRERGTYGLIVGLVSAVCVALTTALAPKSLVSIGRWQVEPSVDVLAPSIIALVLGLVVIMWPILSGKLGRDDVLTLRGFAVTLRSGIAIGVIVIAGAGVYLAFTAGTGALQLDVMVVISVALFALLYVPTVVGMIIIGVLTGSVTATGWTENILGGKTDLKTVQYDFPLWLRLLVIVVICCVVLTAIGSQRARLSPSAWWRSAILYAIVGAAFAVVTPFRFTSGVVDDSSSSLESLLLSLMKNSPLPEISNGSVSVSVGAAMVAFAILGCLVGGARHPRVVSVLLPYGQVIWALVRPVFAFVEQRSAKAAAASRQRIVSASTRIDNSREVNPSGK